MTQGYVREHNTQPNYSYIPAPVTLSLICNLSCSDTLDRIPIIVSGP